MITGKELFESYSENFEGQKMFSTGNDELDGILEEVYYSGLEDGYDYAQKEFARTEYTQDDIDNLKRIKDSDILAERKAKRGKGKRAYNRALKEAQYQARRRAKRDWKDNTVNREGYSY